MCVFQPEDVQNEKKVLQQGFGLKNHRVAVEVRQEGKAMPIYLCTDPPTYLQKKIKIRRQKVKIRGRKG